MKHRELTGFLVIAIVLVLLGLFFFMHSQFIGHMASFRIHSELQQIRDSKNSEKSLTLSREKASELIEYALHDEIRWRRTTASSIKTLFYSSILLFLLGCIQIALFLYIYRRKIAVAPMPVGSN